VIRLRLIFDLSLVLLLVTHDLITATLVVIGMQIVRIIITAATRFLNARHRRVIEVEPRHSFLVIAISCVVAEIERAKVIDHAVKIIDVFVKIIVRVLLVHVLVHVEARYWEINVVLILVSVLEPLKGEDENFWQFVQF
jgi:hypothetical protein